MTLPHADTTECSGWTDVGGRLQGSVSGRTSGEGGCKSLHPADPVSERRKGRVPLEDQTHCVPQPRTQEPARFLRRDRFRLGHEYERKKLKCRIETQSRIRLRMGNWMYSRTSWHAPGFRGHSGSLVMSALIKPLRDALMACER
ncbi:hypothetical protein P7K49_035124 [Saguinus oedipus]|uniref:Uncharacterized protein n=1 Tax=Saguinus oedipus TaxID=9490 RepID=A0ABQ9TWN6_SAGOE|nr:hypothetical protein P7K49_035124 [Saguinus oedipus]